MNVEQINGDVIIDLFAGTVPLPCLFYDMDRIPQVENNDPHVVIVNNTHYPYWWYNYPAGSLYPYAYSYAVDFNYDGQQWPAYDESKVQWGVALRFDDDEVPITILVDSFIRGKSLRINLSDYVPDRVQHVVDIFIVATYPGMRPSYCPPGQQAGTFCWARLNNFQVSVNGEMQSEAVDTSGHGLGLIEINWPFNATNQFTLTTNVQGQGTVDGAGSYDAGTQVTVTASAAGGWHFDHWTVNGTVGSSNLSAHVQMDSDVTVVAYFAEDQAPPPVNVAGVEFTRNGGTGTMRINPGTYTLREITADASAAFLPAGTTFSDITMLGVEIVNLPSPYWYLAEFSAGTMTANAWSAIIPLDGNGTDSNGVAKTVPMANWATGHAIPFYKIASVPGRIFSLNTGVNCGTLNDQILPVDVTGYIWPASK